MTHKSSFDSASIAVAVQAFNMEAGNNPENLSRQDCAVCPSGEENSQLALNDAGQIIVIREGSTEREVLWDLTVPHFPQPVR